MKQGKFSAFLTTLMVSAILVGFANAIPSSPAVFEGFLNVAQEEPQYWENQDMLEEARLNVWTQYSQEHLELIQGRMDLIKEKHDWLLGVIQEVNDGMLARYVALSDAEKAQYWNYQDEYESLKNI